MDLKALVQILWMIGIACQAILGLVLLRKQTWKHFPLFTAYFGVGFGASVFVYFVQHHPAMYFYSFWIAETAGIVLGFAVVYEIFTILFSNHDALRRLTIVISRLVLALLLVAGIVVVIRHSPFGFASITSAVFVIEESARIIELGLLMCLFVLSTAFGLHWRQQVFGVALGLGLFIAVELIAVTVRATLGNAAHDALNVVRIVSFNLSLLIWIGYMLAPERATTQEQLPERSQLEQWNQAVMELISQ